MIQSLKICCMIGCMTALSACGIFGKDEPEIIFNDAVGPNSKALTKQLPNDLRGDSDNARYNSATRPADMKPKSDQ